MTNSTAIAHPKYGFADPRLDPIADEIEASFRGPWSRPREEPRLDDMLTDPIVRLVMCRDGIDRRDVEAALNRGRGRMRVMPENLRSDDRGSARTGTLEGPAPAHCS